MTGMFKDLTEEEERELGERLSRASAEREKLEAEGKWPPPDRGKANSPDLNAPHVAVM